MRAVTEGWTLGGYTYTAYKAESATPAAGTVTVLSPDAKKKETTAAFEEAQVVATAVTTTRDWVNVPPGDFTPPIFADAVSDAVKQLGKGRGQARVDRRRRVFLPDLADHRLFLRLPLGGRPPGGVPGDGRLGGRPLLRRQGLQRASSPGVHRYAPH